MKRCIYPRANGTACNKVAKGKPPLCAQHEKYRDEIEEEEGLGKEVLDALFDRPEVQKLVGQFSGLLDRVSGTIDNPTKVFRSAMGRVPQKPILAARNILGFSPDEKLSEEKIKDRQRALAKVYHPDLTNGSDEAMKRVNTAADILLKELK